MRPRISGGLPRGGLGYLGFGVAGASIVLSVILMPWPATILTAVLVLPSLWFAAGIRADFGVGEGIDEIISESSEPFYETVTGKSRVSKLRLSTAVVVMALIGVVFAVVRLAL